MSIKASRWKSSSYFFRTPRGEDYASSRTLLFCRVFY